jgi:hypothetical protein
VDVDGTGRLTMAYTGPVPPQPTTEPATDPKWTNWWAYQTALTNGRYDDERAARAVVADKQHAERTAATLAHAAAQQATADALVASVAAQQALAAAMALPTPTRLPTRAELAFAILRDHPQATILTNGQLVNGAAGIVDAFVAKYPGAVSG